MRNLVVVMVVLGVVVAISGCASVSEVNMGSEFSRSDNGFQLKLESKGQIIIAQKYTAKAKCSAAKKALIVQIKGEPGTPPVPVVSGCDSIGGYVSWMSKDALQPGTYSIRTRKGEGSGLLSGKLAISAQYQDSDFNSGTDFMPDGGKELAAGSVVKGMVDAPKGNATDWIKISGKGAVTALTFIDNSDEKVLTALVYDLSQGARRPKLIGKLPHKATKSFANKNGKLFVKVKGENLLSVRAYSMIRGEALSAAPSVATSGSKLTVVDCYAVADGESVVLLEAGEDVKVSDEVSVFGKSTQSELVPLGDCEVTAVQGNQASCKLSVSVDSKYVEFKAVAKPRG